MRHTPHELAAPLNAATVHLMRALRRAEPGGLSVTQRSALMLIVHRGPIPIGELARAEGVGAPGMTKTIGILERRGWAIRERDPRDGRYVTVRATRRGKILVLQSREHQVSRLREALGSLRAHELEQLGDSLETLRTLVSRLEAIRGPDAARGRPRLPHTPAARKRRSSTGARGPAR